MIQPGMKVTVTIEATIVQAFDGAPVYVSYGNGQTLAIRPGEPGVTIKAAG
jgi:hypothetical protein